MKHLFITMIALGTVASAGAALADTTGRLNVPQGEWQSPSAIADKLRGQGYQVIEIESDDGAYEVELIDGKGVKIEAHVHPSTGEFVYGYDD